MDARQGWLIGDLLTAQSFVMVEERCYGNTTNAPNLPLRNLFLTRKSLFFAVGYPVLILIFD